MPGFKANSKVGKRKLLINHMTEAMQDMMAGDTDLGASTDSGKPLVFTDSSVMEIAGDGDEIVGFLEAVNEHKEHGGNVGVGVREQGNVWALDETGTLAVGDAVVAGTQSALGVHPLAAPDRGQGGQDPKARVKAGAPTVHVWVVWAVYETGVDRPVLLRKA